MTPLSREDALTRLRQCRDLQPGEGTMQVATGIVDAILEGEEGEPVCVYCAQAEGHSPRCSVTKFGAPEHRMPAR